jgi:hypothetical protein
MVEEIQERMRNRKVKEKERLQGEKKLLETLLIEKGESGLGKKRDIFLRSECGGVEEGKTLFGCELEEKTLLKFKAVGETLLGLVEDENQRRQHLNCCGVEGILDLDLKGKVIERGRGSWKRRAETVRRGCFKSFWCFEGKKKQKTTRFFFLHLRTKPIIF